MRANKAGGATGRGRDLAPGTPGGERRLSVGRPPASVARSTCDTTFKLCAPSRLENPSDRAARYETDQVTPSTPPPYPLLTLTIN